MKSQEEVSQTVIKPWWYAELYKMVSKLCFIIVSLNRQHVKVVSLCHCSELHYGQKN